MTTNNKMNERSSDESFWREEGGDKWSKNIDLLERQHGPLTEVLIDRCGVTVGEKVLDVGCGGGLTSMSLVKQVGDTGRVLGVDISETVLEIAKRRGRNIHNLDFQVADAGSEDLGEGAFDLITSRFGLMFFSRPIAGFTNLHRHLRPGGRLVFMCWRTREENPWMAVPAEAAFAVLPHAEPPREEPDRYTPGPFSLGKKAWLESLLENAGFRDIHMQPVDSGMRMGDLDEASHIATQFGPAAKALGEAVEKDREAAIDAIRKALREYATTAGVIVPSSAWIVAAA